jgi:hypothetical protein
LIASTSSLATPREMTNRGSRESWASRRPARWTAPAFDRCLLLALIYPIVTTAGVWIWSGHVGTAERVLGLWETPADDPHGGLRRLAFGLSALIGLYAGLRAGQPKRVLPTLLWFGAGAGAVAVAGVVAGAATATAAILVVGAGAFALPSLSPSLSKALLLSVPFSLSLSLPLLVLLSLALLAVSLALALALPLSVSPSHRFPPGASKPAARAPFSRCSFLAATLAAFAGVWLLSRSDYWGFVGALLLLFGVLTLVNAPFDWFAIGLTRALLRRGLAPGGRGPFFYAAVDAIIAPPVIALLAFVTVFAVQTFDDIAVLRAGPSARILPLDDLFDGLKTRPADPEFWWVWLMLFSTLIPSALNLCIAAASLIRGLPFLNAWIVWRMTPGVRNSDRLLLASVLSGQIVGGFLATGLALYFLGVWFLPTWLPLLGGYVRDFSEALAAYNAPARIMMWFAGAR